MPLRDAHTQGEVVGMHRARLWFTALGVLVVLGAVVTGSVAIVIVVSRCDSLLVEVLSFFHKTREPLFILRRLFNSLHCDLELLHRRCDRQSEIVLPFTSNSSERLAIERRNVMTE